VRHLPVGSVTGAGVTRVAYTGICPRADPPAPAEVYLAGMRKLRPPGIGRAAVATDLVLIVLAVSGSLALGGQHVVVYSSRSAQWWAITALLLVALPLRRAFALTALGLATAAAIAHLWLGYLPVPADAIALITVYQVAADRSRRTSLAALAGVLTVALAWSAYVAAGPAWPWPTSFVQPITADGRTTEAQRAKLDILAENANPLVTWGGFPVLSLLAVLAWAAGRGTAHRRAHLNDLRERAHTLARDRDQQAALAVAAERARITRDLHDVLAHGLAVIVVQAQGAIADLDRQPQRSRAALEAIADTGRQSLTEMRQLVAAQDNVAQPWQPTPGLAGLDGLIDSVRQAGTAVEYRVDGPPQPLPAMLDLGVYRLVQEALTNTVKHAGAAATATVCLRYRPDHVDVEVVNTGAPARIDPTGNGLRGMRERVAQLGGQFTAEAPPAGGFRVAAQLPLPTQP
jgi:signal transduction histidine kinase